MEDIQLSSSPLGQNSRYVDQYDNKQLFPMPRQPKRDSIGAGQPLLFKGHDIWTAYELSWLNMKGKPVVATADIIIPCESTHLIESKSFKLYLNSFNNTRFLSEALVRETILIDLENASGMPVQVNIRNESDFNEQIIAHWKGRCLDDLDIFCKEYKVNSDLLHTHSEKVCDYSVYSHLLKSNCLVTGQPDWGSVHINYTGNLIDEASLLQYIVSFRNHNEFHEQCVERIFMDIMRKCNPGELTVYARYTRRGGLDINPIRSTKIIDAPKNKRLFRQ